MVAYVFLFLWVQLYFCFISRKITKKLGFIKENGNKIAQKALKVVHPPPYFDDFLVFGALFSRAEFQHSDLILKETCGKIAHLVAESGGNRWSIVTFWLRQLTKEVTAIP